jgi:hypothetical protein
MFDWDRYRLTFKVELTPSVDPDGSYVSEQTTMNGKITKFGPMSAALVEPFITERKEYWRKMVDQQTRRYAR